MTDTTTVPILLRTVAYSRSGDKGEVNNVVVIPYDEGNYDWLREHLTVDVVRDVFGKVVRGPITRYEFRGIRALNFVMEKALEGGVSRSLNIDAHGKSRANLMLGIRLDAPPPPCGIRTPELQPEPAHTAV
jgi:hypothetical protein